MEKMSKAVRELLRHANSKRALHDYTHAVKPFPPRSDRFSLNLRHIRIVGTIFFSKCGGFNVIVLATRLHLYRAIVVWQRLSLATSNEERRANCCWLNAIPVLTVAELLSESQRRRSHENAKSHAGFSWNDVVVRRHGVGTAGKD